MDNESVSYTGPNRELPMDVVSVHADTALRLLEAERLLNLHKAVENALVDLPKLDNGCRAVLRAVGETLSAESVQLLLPGRGVNNLIWPTDTPVEPQAAELANHTTAGRVSWSHPMGNGTRLALAVPIATGAGPMAYMLLSLRQARDPSKSLLEALIVLGQRMGTYLLREQAQEDLRRQALLVDLSPDGIFVRRLDGTITFWSLGAEALYGWTRQEALGRLTQDLLHTRYPQPLHEVTEILRHSSRWSGELTHRTKDGREIIVQSFWQAQFDEKGAVTELMESNVDITERKHLLEAEAAARAKAESTSDQLRIILTRTRELYETSHRLGLVNTPQEVLEALLSTSYLRDAARASIALFERPWLEDNDPPNKVRILAVQVLNIDRSAQMGALLPTNPEWLRRNRVRWQACAIDVETNTTLPDEVRAYLRAMNTRTYVIFPLTALRQFTGFVSIHFQQPKALSAEDLRHVQGLVDQVAATIHNLRVLEQESAARREAERANELRLRFLGMISHELRTPLTAIKGFTTTLMAKDVTWEEAQWRDFLAIIDAEADKLTDMIEQLLDLSRIESGSLRVDPQPTSMDTVVDTVLPQLTTVVAQHDFAINIPGDLPSVLADGLRIGQVLVNLVSNAAKYSPAGTAITFAATDNGNGFVRVSVRDDGPGIAPEDKPYIFEAFRRGSDGRARQTKGAGLGLAICKGIVEAHGGRIWLEEHAEPGTVIAFTLPVA